jgi:hypothetical protein
VLDAVSATTTSSLRAAVGPRSARPARRGGPCVHGGAAARAIWTGNPPARGAHPPDALPSPPPPNARLVSFLCDLTHIAIVMEHARLNPGAGVSSARPSAALLEGVSGRAAAARGCPGRPALPVPSANVPPAVGSADAPAPAPPPPSQDPRLLLELAEPLLAVARAQAQLHAQRFASEAAEAARQEAAMEAAAARLKEAYYSLAAQKARLEEELVGRARDAGVGAGGRAGERGGGGGRWHQPGPGAPICSAQAGRGCRRYRGKVLSPEPSPPTPGPPRRRQAAKGVVVPELCDTADGLGLDQRRDALAMPLPAAVAAPPALAAAQQEACGLWDEVQAHLERFSDLPGLVEGVVGSETHPHAIDGAKLRALAGLDEGGAAGGGGTAAAAGATPGGGGPASAAAELDIVAMLEGWVDRLEVLEPQIAELDGTGLSGAPSTPLLATADARSHAPHLFAQLGVHRTCQEGMRELEVAIEDELAATGEAWPRGRGEA